jgi:aminoglycoside phosphotransferase (APT) family kinase protein
MENRPVGDRFTGESTYATLKTACDLAQLDLDRAELIRLGENALYLLPDAAIVVRIARTMDYWQDATKEVSVSRWLAQHDFPGAEVTEFPQPIIAGGHPVTFWRYIHGHPARPEDVAELGGVLARLHHLPAPTEFRLPNEDIFGRVERRIETAPVPSDDKDFLVNRCEQLKQELPRLRFPLSPSPTHGDAHIKNLMISDGRIILIDFERFAWGQPEWDLSMTATEYITAGFWTEAQYAAFAGAYGYDVMEWHGFEVLRATHEIKMTTWIMQNVHESAEIAAEYEARMHTIRTGQGARTWRPF